MSEVSVMNLVKQALRATDQLVVTHNGRDPLLCPFCGATMRIVAFLLVTIARAPSNLRDPACAEKRFPTR